MEGYAFWSMILEYLTEQDGNEMEFCDREIKLFSGQLGCTFDIAKAMINEAIDLELLFNKDGFIHSESLDEILAPVYEKRKRAKQSSATRIRRETAKTPIPVTEIPHIPVITVTEIAQSRVEKSRKEKVIKDVSINLGLKLPFNSQEFAEAWMRWLRYKKSQWKFTFKSVETEQTSIDQLAKNCNYDEGLAIATITHTISKTWQGFVIPKDYVPEPIKPKPATSTQKDYSNLSDWDREIQEHFDRLITDPAYKARKIESERIYSHENGEQMFKDYPEFFKADGKFKYPEFRP